MFHRGGSHLRAIAAVLRCLQGRSVVDIAPTVLHLFGIPPGADMDCKTLIDAFDGWNCSIRFQAGIRSKGKTAATAQVRGCRVYHTYQPTQICNILILNGARDGNRFLTGF